MAYLQQHWKDTKKVAKELNISNHKLLSILEKNNFIVKNKYGQKQVTQKGLTMNLARVQERTWAYSGRDKSVNPQQIYTVIQLNPKGIDFVQQQLQEKAIA